MPDILKPGAGSPCRQGALGLALALALACSGGTLSLRTWRTSSLEADKRCCLEVRDSGVGMNQETRCRCLKPFYTTKGERGTGPGLAMVYRMAQRHSAELDIDSVPGQGTAVRLSLSAVSASFVSSGSAPSQPAQPGRRLRIPRVDDDPLLMQSLPDTLKEDGHPITCTNGGQARIDAFLAAHARQEPFDVVVTHFGMPYVDGRKVAAAIKAVAATPIIMLTGWGQRLIAIRDKPAHVGKALSKPPRIAELRTSFLELVA